MEQATLHIDMIKLIERFEPIAVIWQNCRVVKLSSKHKQNPLSKEGGFLINIFGSFSSYLRKAFFM